MEDTLSLSRGGATHNYWRHFFVSYLYYRHIDLTHKNWDSIKTQTSRINTINRSESYHKVWLNHIGSMSDSNLNRNSNITNRMVYKLGDKDQCLISLSNLRFSLHFVLKWMSYPVQKRHYNQNATNKGVMFQRNCYE